MVIGMGLERSAGQFVPSCAENLHTGIRSQMPPSSDEQIRFMVNIQRLLDEGLFTASYKFALLLALAVLSIEQGRRLWRPPGVDDGRYRGEVRTVLLASGGAVCQGWRGDNSPAEHR